MRAASASGRNERPVIFGLKRRAETVGRRFRRGFRRTLEDGTAPLSLDMGRDSRTLLIAAGGLLGEMSMPPFEFFKVTTDLPCKRVFLRDLRQAWYHQGLPGHGTSLLSVAESLRELTALHEVDRLVFAGSSAGGYAALVFGTLLEADAVLCFGPQTVLELDALAEINDQRWNDQLRPLFAAHAMDGDWTDLRTALPRARCADTRYQIYFDDSVSTDRLHAERLRGLEGVRLYHFGRGGHRVAQAMRDSGALHRVLERALLPSPAAAGASSSAAVASGSPRLNQCRHSPTAPRDRGPGTRSAPRPLP